MSRSVAGSLLSLALVCLPVGLGAGCAGELDEPDRFSTVLARFATDGGAFVRDGGTPSVGDAGNGGAPACVIQLFKQTCGVTDACHGAGSQVLDLISPGVTARVLDQTSESDLCKDRVYVDSTGGESLLADKLQQAPPCGSPMPLGGTLTAAQRTCLEDWVRDLGGSVP